MVVVGSFCDIKLQINNFPLVALLVIGNSYQWYKKISLIWTNVGVFGQILEQMLGVFDVMIFNCQGRCLVYLGLALMSNILI